MQTKTKLRLKLQETVHLTPSIYILRLEKNTINFHAGQNILLNLPGNREFREYSIYSGENEPTIDVLIKEVQDGYLSRLLKRVRPGESLEVEGPFGHFVMDDEDIRSKKFLFIASGTGISPFHSFIVSYPQLDYILVHGIKSVNETYDKQDYQYERYIACTSQDALGDYEGRVTGWLAEQDTSPDTMCYLCGNSSMIDDVFDILQAKGLPVDNIKAEVYF